MSESYLKHSRNWYEKITKDGGKNISENKLLEALNELSLEKNSKGFLNNTLEQVKLRIEKILFFQDNICVLGNQERMGHEDHGHILGGVENGHTGGIEEMIYTVADTVEISVQVSLCPPEAVAQDVTAMLDGNGQATITPEIVDNGSSDNYAINSGETVIFTATDGAGNTSSAEGFINTEDFFTGDIIEENKPVMCVKKPTIVVSGKGIKVENLTDYRGILTIAEDQEEIPEEYEFYIYNLGDEKEGHHIGGPFPINSEVNLSLEAGEYKICVLAKYTNIISEVSESFFYDGNKYGWE